MAADVKFNVKEAVDKQILTPVTVSEELEQEFIKKSRSASWKLLPISIIVSVIVIAVIALLIYFFNLLIFSTLGLICIFYPAFAIYNIFATAKALKKKDYEFLSGEIIGKNDDGSYRVKGLADQNIHTLIGKKEYDPGSKAIIARLGGDLNIISE
jgi:hypothetical protein